MSDLIGAIFILIITFIIIALFGFLMAIPVMYLWNWLVPDILGLTEITYLQAWGLYFLSSLLFKSTNTSTSD